MVYNSIWCSGKLKNKVTDLESIEKILELQLTLLW
jgi:hypothetical protein